MFKGPHPEVALQSSSPGWHNQEAASPGPGPVRLPRWDRRHQALVAGGAVLVLTVTLAVAVGLLLLCQANARARDAERRAREVAARAEAVNSFLVNNLLAPPAPGSEGRALTLAEALDRAVPRIGPACAEQPLVEAAVRLSVGNSYRRLGLWVPARDQLSQALELRR